MSRISSTELVQLRSIEQKAQNNRESYLAFKQEHKHLIPALDDPDGLIKAKEYLTLLFSKFNILETVVGERGYLLASDNDTHYRGRVAETLLDGSFDGKSTPDFGWGDLKLIETKEADSTALVQVMTCGVIFTKNRKTKEYEVVEYNESNFVKKMRQALLVGYRKEGKQLGKDVTSITAFSLDNPVWASQLKEDWESISEEMIEAIEEEKAGIRVRRASGICKSDSSGKRRPHGYLGIRSDSVVFTPKFFREVVNETSTGSILHFKQ